MAQPPTLKLSPPPDYPLPLFIGRSGMQGDRTRRRWPRGGHPCPLAPYKTALSLLPNPSSIPLLSLAPLSSPQRESRRSSPCPHRSRGNRPPRATPWRPGGPPSSSPSSTPLGSSPGRRQRSPPDHLPGAPPPRPRPSSSSSPSPLMHICRAR